MVLSTVIAFAGCHGPAFNLPPADRLMAPGPGVDGPGPGVLTAADFQGMTQKLGEGTGNSGGDSGGWEASCEPMPTVQVMFANPSGMQVYWDNTGSGGFDGPPVVVPGRTNFDQAGLYRCKLTSIPGHEGVELYPTVEIGTPTPRTIAFISHNTIPLQLTPDDLNQVTAGNFVTKVIYLPDPEFQHLAVAGVETLVSTRLDPGLDPVQEADRRGSILAIVRVGNKDIEMPGSNFQECFSATLNDRGEVAQVSHTEAVAGGCSCGMHGGGTCPEGPLSDPSMQGGVGWRRHCGCPQPDRPRGPFPTGPAGPTASELIPPGGGTGPVMPGWGPTNAPLYGMPMTGTPIGLPGPPHIPLGGPAGLQRHVIANHTHQYIPKPSHKVNIHVKQSPGISYPPPRTHAYIHQYNHPTCAHCVGSGP